MKNNKKTILICGATGFIGRNLLQYYHSTGEYNIRALYHNKPPLLEYKGVEWVECDLRKEEQVKNAVKGVDIVLQFAFGGMTGVSGSTTATIADNIIMSSLLLKECFYEEVENFIFPSCTIMYQKSETALKTTDFNPSDTIQPHYFGTGHTKVYLENMCDFYSREGKTKFTAFRHSNVYGPYDKYDLDKSHVFAASILKVMNSQDGKVNVWGPGEDLRDVLYIDDVVNFVDTAIKKQTTPYELFNVGLGKGTKIKDMIQKMITYSGRDLEMVHDLSKPSSVSSLFLDYSKAKELLGWEPQYTLDEGIKKTLEWYKTYYNN